MFKPLSLLPLWHFYFALRSITFLNAVNTFMFPFSFSNFVTSCSLTSANLPAALARDEVFFIASRSF